MCLPTPPSWFLTTAILNGTTKNYYFSSLLPDLPTFPLAPIVSYQHSTQSNSLKIQARLCHSTAANLPNTPTLLSIKAQELQ